MVASDKSTKFMWIQIKDFVHLSRDIYIAVCYFPPTSSLFAIHSDSVGDTYLELYANITQYSKIREVILLGDFNTCTKALQIPLYDHLENAFCTQEMAPKSVGLHRLLDNALELITTYGGHLLQLGEPHKLLILNGLPCFPAS